VLSVEDLIVAETPMPAYSPATIYPASLLEGLLADARTRAVTAIGQAREVLLAAGLKVLDQQPVPACDPCVGILDASQTWSADMIIVGSHGRRGLDRLLMGSVAESVAVHAKCSVQVIRKKS
jgi:nucleotide-binding universal stress UspA family protein